MKTIVLISAFAVITGCANVTTMKILRSPDGTISINSGKDVTIGSLSYTSPSGEQLDVADYTSNASAAAIGAQTSREKQVIDGVIEAIKAGAALRP